MKMKNNAFILIFLFIHIKSDIDIELYSFINNSIIKRKETLYNINQDSVITDGIFTDYYYSDNETNCYAVRDIFIHNLKYYAKTFYKLLYEYGNNTVGIINFYSFSYYFYDVF